MMNKTGYIKIHSDQWHDNGKLYKVLQYKQRENSTAVELSIKHEDGTQESRVVPQGQIEWIEDGDW